MKKKSFMMMVLSAFLLLAMSLVSLAGCSSGGSPSGGDSSGNATSTADAQQLYEDKCSTCHSLDIVDSSEATGYDEWNAIVKSMQAKTTTISDADAEEITNYLANR